ncbi:MAG: hypothetical protein IB617_02885 [Candidatus Nealsonbacteria bacterium]|nr:MAG: hypothetical protein IB617_02885 [Candidatus Nealsonbacteria bacterium]
MNYRDSLERFKNRIQELEMEIGTNKTLKQVRGEKDILALSETDWYFLCKLRVAELMFYLRNKILFHFGMLVIFGWQEEWTKEWVNLPDSSQNIFKERGFNIFYNSILDIASKFLQVIQFDGAILIDNKGMVTNSGMFIEGLRPTDVAEKLKLPEGEDFSSRFGFKIKVHTRHLSAISASYQFKDTTVYTISKKTGDLRIFEKGKIIYSTIKEE